MRPGSRPTGSRSGCPLPKRAQLAVQYGRDGYRLLEAAWAPGAPGWGLQGRVESCV